MSKYRFKNSSIYYDGTSIPRNKLTIQNAEEIHELENSLIEQSYDAFFSALNENTHLDETYFKNLHEKTFESLYDFAGVYRDANMSKGDSQFCLAQYLHSESKRIFDELKADNYLNDAKDNKQHFAQKLAYYQCELIALHPFYEVNGRITRLYIDLLALYNGYHPIDYRASVDNTAYIDASIACVQYADSGLLEKIIFEGLVKWS